MPAKSAKAAPAKEAPKAAAPAPKAKNTKRIVKKNRKPRLFVPGRVVSFKRTHKSVDPHTIILKIDGVLDKTHVPFYLGKRVAYVYRAAKKTASATEDGKKTSKRETRKIWGKITRAHGRKGMVKATFSPNLPAKAFGRSVRVHLFPSHI
eukprot:TRINITY_DN59657_c0_g1_i1.p1 TRINITY_DN59657_c0_g1~~TRINITY_DN59657_c0_g1_i1.p1  ORF type:complete len:150 (+),score=24.32 TRINITY_DN59657_c0_g1_i1:27-476(+)